MIRNGKQISPRFERSKKPLRASFRSLRKRSEELDDIMDDNISGAGGDLKNIMDVNVSEAGGDLEDIMNANISGAGGDLKDIMEANISGAGGDLEDATNAYISGTEGVSSRSDYLQTRIETNLQKTTFNSTTELLQMEQNIQEHSGITQRVATYSNGETIQDDRQVPLQVYVSTTTNMVAHDVELECENGSGLVDAIVLGISRILEEGDEKFKIVFSRRTLLRRRLNASPTTTLMYLQQETNVVDYTKNWLQFDVAFSISEDSTLGVSSDPALVSASMRHVISSRGDERALRDVFHFFDSRIDRVLLDPPYEATTQGPGAKNIEFGEAVGALDPYEISPTYTAIVTYTGFTLLVLDFIFVVTIAVLTRMRKRAGAR